MNTKRRKEVLHLFGFLNARSVRNKASEVNEFVTDNNIDILGVCETWLTQDDKAVISELTPVGYTHGPTYKWTFIDALMNSCTCHCQKCHKSISDMLSLFDPHDRHRQLAGRGI